MPAGGIVFAGRCSRAVARPRPIGGRAHATGPAGPYTPGAAPPPPRPPPSRMLPLPRRLTLPLLAAARARAPRRARASGPRRRRDLRRQGLPRGRAGEGHVHPRPRPRLRLAAMDEAEEGPRPPPLPRDRQRPRPARDEGAAAEGPRKPGQRLRFSVATTRAPRCGRALRATAKFYAPTTPAGVGAAKLSETAVRLSLDEGPQRRRQARRLPRLRNGATYRQVKGTAADVAVPAGVAEHAERRLRRHPRPRLQGVGAGRAST